MTRRIIEPFDFYKAAGGLGRPYLMRCGGTVAWSEGSLFHYVEFARAVDIDGLNQELTALWRTWQPRRKRKAEMIGYSCGPVIGCLSAVPTKMAELAFEIVKRYFVAALGELLEQSARRIEI